MPVSSFSSHYFLLQLGALAWGSLTASGRAGSVISSLQMGSSTQGLHINAGLRQPYLPPSGFIPGETWTGKETQPLLAESRPPPNWELSELWFHYLKDAIASGPKLRKKTQLPTSMSCGIRGSSGASWGDERLLKQKDRIMQHHTLLPPSAEWTSAVVPTLVLWASQVCLRREVENGSSFLSGWEQVYQSWGRECLKKKSTFYLSNTGPSTSCFNSLNPQNSPMRKLLLSSSFYRQGNRCLGQLDSLPRVMGSKWCQGCCSSPLQVALRGADGLLQRFEVCRIGFLFHGGLTSALSPGVHTCSLDISPPASFPVGPLQTMATKGW